MSIASVVVALLAPAEAGGASPLTVLAAARTAPVEELAPGEEMVAADEAAEARAQAQRLIDEGLVKFDRQDYVGAIELWQRAYEILPVCEKSQLYGPLATAHWSAYQLDPDPQHLSRAQQMLTRQLEGLGITEREVHAETQDQLAEITAELARLDEQRVQRERELASREVLARRLEIEEAERVTRARTERVRALKLWMGTGGATVGLGAVSIVTAALLERERRFNESLIQDEQLLEEPDEDFIAFLERQKKAFRGATYALGVLGGALVVSGTTVLIIGAVRHRRSSSRVQARVTPGLHGLTIRF